MALNPGEYYQAFSTHQDLIVNQAGDIVGIRNLTGSGADFRGGAVAVVNSLESDSTTQALAAAQGAQLSQSLTALSSAISTSAATAANRATHTGFDPVTENLLTQASYTLTAADSNVGAFVDMNSAVANSVVIPTNAAVPIRIGAVIAVAQLGTGATTIRPAAGVSAPTIQISRQGGQVFLRKWGTDAWVIYGDIAATGVPQNTIPPSISGGPAAGSVFTRVAGTWVGTPTPSITGQWYADGVAISGQTASTYTSANPGDAAKVITYRETATSTAGSATANSNAITVTSAAATKPVNSSLPVISGTATVNSTLTATAGGWSNTPTTYRYEWLRNAETTPIRDSGFIAGATDTYLLTANEAGTTIKVRVTAHNAAGDTVAPATSVGTPIAGALPTQSGSSVPAIYDSLNLYQTGSTLTVDVGTWANNPTFSYQWYRAAFNSDTLTPIGTNSATYTTVGADGDKYISCAVTGTTTSGSTTVNALPVAIAVASALPVNVAPPSISGLTPIGSVLTCAPGTWTNSPSFAYQWKRGATNVGTNSSTYTSQAADGGSAITCVVTATNAGLSANATSFNSITVGSAGSGSLLIGQATQGDFTLNSLFPVDWSVWNGSATPDKKSGGGALVGKSDVPSFGATYAGPSGALISWTGGTPNATGTSTNGSITTDWGSENSGWDVTFPVGTSPTVVGVVIGGYNQICTVTATLSDGSAAPVSSSADSGSGGSTPTLLFTVTAAAAAAGQTLTLAVRTKSPEPYGDGNMLLRAAGIAS